MNVMTWIARIAVNLLEDGAELLDLGGSLTSMG